MEQYKILEQTSIFEDLSFKYLLAHYPTVLSHIHTLLGIDGLPIASSCTLALGHYNPFGVILMNPSINLPSPYSYTDSNIPALNHFLEKYYSAELNELRAFQQATFAEIIEALPSKQRLLQIIANSLLLLQEDQKKVQNTALAIAAAYEATIAKLGYDKRKLEADPFSRQAAHGFNRTFNSNLDRFSENYTLPRKHLENANIGLLKEEMKSLFKLELSLLFELYPQSPGLLQLVPVDNIEVTSGVLFFHGSESDFKLQPLPEDLLNRCKVQLKFESDYKDRLRPFFSLTDSLTGQEYYLIHKKDRPLAPLPGNAYQVMHAVHDTNFSDIILSGSGYRYQGVKTLDEAKTVGFLSFIENTMRLLTQVVNSSANKHFDTTSELKRTLTLLRDTEMLYIFEYDRMSEFNSAKDMSKLTFWLFLKNGAAYYSRLSRLMATSGISCHDLFGVYDYNSEVKATPNWGQNPFSLQTETNNHSSYSARNTSREQIEQLSTIPVLSVFVPRGATVPRYIATDIYQENLVYNLRPVTNEILHTPLDDALIISNTDPALQAGLIMMPKLENYELTSVVLKAGWQELQPGKDYEVYEHNGIIYLKVGDHVVDPINYQFYYLPHHKSEVEGPEEKIAKGQLRKFAKELQKREEDVYQELGRRLLALGKEHQDVYAYHVTSVLKSLTSYSYNESSISFDQNENFLEGFKPMCRPGEALFDMQCDGSRLFALLVLHRLGARHIRSENGYLLTSEKAVPNSDSTQPSSEYLITLGDAHAWLRDEISGRILDATSSTRETRWDILRNRVANQFSILDAESTKPIPEKDLATTLNAVTNMLGTPSRPATEANALAFIANLHREDPIRQLTKLALLAKENPQTAADYLAAKHQIVSAFTLNELQKLHSVLYSHKNEFDVKRYSATAGSIWQTV